MGRNTPSPPDTVTPDDDIDDTIRAEHQSIPQQLRDRVLSRDGYCQVCGCGQPDIAETWGLLVQRIAQDPTHCSPNDPENLVTRCLRCARWIEQMPRRDDLPPALQERLDGADLKTTRVQILQYLHRNGPTSTGELADNVDLANETSVRRALYDLMGWDVHTDDVDRLLVKDRMNQTYGLPWQIPDDRRARGVIPLKPHRRRNRILDAVVHRSLTILEGHVEQPRVLVADIVDRDTNQTYHMERRAEAFQFPFEEWAETKRPRHDEAAAVEAIGILAGATDNVSRRRVAEPLVAVLERDDEHELAAVLRETLLGDDDPSFDALAGQSTGASSADRTDDGEAAAAAALQTFGDGDEDDAEPHSVDAAADRPGPYPDDYRRR
jgi:hypothetical protein